MATLPAAADNERRSSSHAYVDTHVRFKDVSMVYTNVPVWVENSIYTMEQLLAEDKYKVVDFDVEYTYGCAMYD
ncbi:putative methyltransferase PMT27 [Hordeum vulgare]|nr:putative methyltransferase PMT27 [Hordeum vulgare]